MAEYEVWLLDPLGTTLDIIDDWLSLTYTRVINDIGSLTLVLDGNYTPFSYLKIDGRIAVYRDGVLDTETTWLIREISRQLDGSGTRTIIVRAVSVNEILGRRIIAYEAGTLSGSTGYTSASGVIADDLMKNIIFQNFGASASVFRQIDSAIATSEQKTTQGGSVSKDYAWANLLGVLQEISQTTITDGSPIYFDVVTPTQSTIEFRTYRNLRGTDHSFPNGNNPVVLSPDLGNLINVTRTYDHTGEVTYVYASGDDGTQTASSVDRIQISPFGLREAYLSVSGTSGSDATLGEAEAVLRAGRPRRTFRGELVNVPGATEYNVHWQWGDKVTAQFEGESIDCTVDAITISVSRGKETIQGNLRAVEE